MFDEVGMLSLDMTDDLDHHGSTRVVALLDGKPRINMLKS